MRAIAVGLGLIAYLWSSPAIAGKVKDREVRPNADAMYTAGLVFTVTGAVSIVGGTALFGVSAQAGPGFLASIDALVLGGGFLTMGGLLMHFGEERRFGYLDRKHAPRRGAGAILAGTLTLAGGAAGFTFGASSSVASCPDGACDPAFVIIPMTIGATAMTLGSTLMVVGIRNRSRYLDWRRKGRRLVLQPTGGASAHGAFIGVGGRF